MWLFSWPRWAGIYYRWRCPRGRKIAAIFAFRSFPQSKWSFVDLFEFPLANIAKATYKNIRKLCSGVFSRKQTLQFAPDTTASCDVSIQLLFSGGSISLCAHTCETRPLYSLQPMSAGEMNADCFKSLSYEVQKYEFYNKVQFYVHNTKQLPPIEAIKELMNSFNYYVNLQLMKFVLSCFEFT